MSDHPLIVGFYTPGPYEGEALRLSESLAALGLRSELTAIECRGSWQANTQFKAKFLRSRLMAHPGRPLLYLDVDALVIRLPRLINKAALDQLAKAQLQLAEWPIDTETGACDVAAVILSGWELLGGTIYLGGTDRSVRLVNRWVELCEEYPVRIPGGLLPQFPHGADAWDQRLLDLAIRDCQRRDGLAFIQLPDEYAWIVGISSPDLHPVIIHTRGRFRFGDAAARASNHVR